MGNKKNDQFTRAGKNDCYRSTMIVLGSTMTANKCICIPDMPLETTLIVEKCACY